MKELVQGAYDIHVHCAPDVVPRAQSLLELGRAAAEAGMGGLGLKDHTGSTTGRVAALNEIHEDSPRFFSALALNPTVGSLNPLAVQAALEAGTDIVYFPTYGAKHQIDVMGIDGFPPAFPLPGGTFEGVTVTDAVGELKPEVGEILDLIAEFDGVLATGHVSPAECLALVAAGQERGIGRMLVTHASELVPGLTIEQQREAVSYGALIEQSFLAVTDAYSHTMELTEIADQIRQVGVDRVIVSSDFGQVPNGPVVPGFARYLGELRELGFSDEEIRTMVVANPERLLLDREV